jgi:hypothetical protein
MLLAKLALGLCGTVAVAGAYTFHEGVMRVDEDHFDGRHVHVWLPAAIVPMALHVVPSQVEDSRQHVRIRTHQGKLLIDVTEPGETVHVACPLVMMEDVARELEAKSPAA